MLEQVLYHSGFPQIQENIFLDNFLTSKQKEPMKYYVLHCARSYVMDFFRNPEAIYNLSFRGLLLYKGLDDLFLRHQEFV